MYVFINQRVNIFLCNLSSFCKVNISERSSQSFTYLLLLVHLILFLSLIVGCQKSFIIPACLSQLLQNRSTFQWVGKIIHRILSLLIISHYQTNRIGQELILINVLCSIHPKCHTVKMLTIADVSLINPELHQTCPTIVISEARI